MSRVTKTLAEQTAIKLLEPKQVDVSDLKLKLKQLITDEVSKTIPFEVMELFKKYPKHFNQKTNSRIQCSGFGYEYYNFYPLPLDGGSINIGTQSGNKILSLSHKIELKKAEYNKLKLDIEVALLGLVTYKRVEAEFPEAFKLFPPITTTALSVDLKSIRCKIDKNNC